MKTPNSFSNLSMSEKRKRLMAMVDMRRKWKREKVVRPISMFENMDKIISKKPINRSSTKMKKINALTYKKMFQKVKNEQGPCIEEYWVPIHLSHMQMEQYCSLLHSNFEALSSSLRNMSSLHDILTKTRKCCDHPYLVDPTLRESLKTSAPIDHLDAEISVSGKLQLLDKLLLEIQRCGLRVVVLFQSMVNTEKISIGDILDDLVDRRFGQHPYIRIREKINTNSERDKRKKDLKMFNSVDSKKFICLLDYRACHRSVRLSRVDVAILFNSDWKPSIDLKALHKITLDSRERLRVFRLYSSFTIEEKALILSKQGPIYDRKTCGLNYNTCHRLLAWGASYLFSKISEDPSSKSQSKSNSKADIDDLVHELSSPLMKNNGSTDRLKSSIISNAQMNGRFYSENILLLGETEEHTKDSCSIEEYLMENGPNHFWTNLFKESPWKGSCSRLPRRVQKSFRSPCYWFDDYEIENETPVRTKLRSKRKARTRFEQSTNHVAECTSNQSSEPQTSPVIPPVCERSSIATPLDSELENIKKEREEITKLHQEKKSMLVSECEKELSEIRKKYDALIDESETCLTNKTKDLEEFYDLVYANKVLAETLVRSCDDTFDKAHQEKTEQEANSVRIVEIPASALVQSEKPCTTTIPTGHSLRGTGIRGPAPHLRSSPSLFASLPTLSNPQTQTELKNVIGVVNTEKMPVLQSTHLWPEMVVEFDTLYDMGCPNLPFLDSN